MVRKGSEGTCGCKKESHVLLGGGLIKFQVPLLGTTERWMIPTDAVLACQAVSGSNSQQSESSGADARTSLASLIAFEEGTDPFLAQAARQDLWR